MLFGPATNTDGTTMNQIKEKHSQQARLTPHPVLKKYYPDVSSRRQRVDEMFDASARYYDRINTMMSFGSGRLYRAWALKRHGLGANMQLLDVGCGTGVLALIAQQKAGADGNVIALDPSIGMLRQARSNGVDNIINGLCEAMPFPAQQFDMLTIGYALRHLDDLNAAFVECHRVLDHGGKLLLLELSKPKNKLGSFFLRIYMRIIIPIVTRVFSRSRHAQLLMRYTWDTIDNCVDPEIILAVLQQAGFERTKHDVILGIFSEYSAIKT
ncbi:MAG: class I SAM-dependent methyltransferase [Gammaproteobacteria bacterium]|jgi:demethylmenaquinone methyltransferase/2-methoxy-6-polyprenyl-1,4-benzoquinol methylase|nr:class I SAM-dependent methyltransferase [Gammaproteobacteria bacterium]